MRADAKVRVLVVDDSLTTRAALRRGLEREGLEVVGMAADPFEAREVLARVEAEVLTLDLDMPRMDGLSFLEKLMAHHPLPVVVLSAFSTEGSRLALRALELGAVEVMEKPRWDENLERPGMARLAALIRAASLARPRVSQSLPRGPLSAGKQGGPPSRQVLALGASTGGCQALLSILASLPGAMPGILVVQHMPPGFTRAFARRLDAAGDVRVKEAEDGEFVRDGFAYLAPGGMHLRLKGRPGHFQLALDAGPEANHVRPSVDVLFESVALSAGKAACAALLTGMGRDGAAGLLAIRKSGGRTLAQDEASCVVYGMPKEAVLLGAAEAQASLEALGEKICALLNLGQAV
jgi:two-component system chemotaxis response regulator CheB